MLVSILPKLSIAQSIGYLKGKSFLMIFDGHVNLKYRYRNRYFCYEVYYADAVRRNKKVIEEYIKNVFKWGKCLYFLVNVFKKHILF